MQPTVPRTRQHHGFSLAQGTFENNACATLEHSWGDSAFEMNLMDGKLSMRSREPCGLILTIVSECAYASYPTSHPSHEQSRKYTCYMKCAYSSEVECLCSAGARFRIIHVGFTWASKCEVRAVDLYATRVIGGKSLTSLRSWVRFLWVFCNFNCIAGQCQL